MAQILVTGGSGFIGAHVILQLLAAGHAVRTTIRDPGREEGVRATLAQAGVGADAPLSFAIADLERDAGWDEAAAGCDHVLHVASPFPIDIPKHEDELIVPAREGTLRVLRAARAAGVKRVVLTSSFAAIGYGLPPRDTPYTETDWTNTEARDTQAYMKSKTLAERAAWDFVADGQGPELTVVNPVAVFGPALGRTLSSSVELVRRLLSGALPATPRLYFGAVDVRDVADLHLRAMTDPAAAGERFLAVAGPSVSLRLMCEILRGGLGQAARKVPRRETPDWLVRLIGLFSPTARAVVPQLGLVRTASADKARRVLGWQPRSNEAAILASAESLIRLGLIPA